jgi:hypothetical protein
MKDIWKKIAIAAGAVASVAGSAKDIPLLPGKYQPIVAAVASIAGILAGLYHPAPGTPAEAPREPAGV